MTTANDVFTTESIGRGDGLLLTARAAGTPLTALKDAGLDQLLARAGHVLMRGFDATVDGFNSLVQAYSSRITLDPARVFHGRAAQKVDSGDQAIGLHIENGATPFIPDLLWFYSVKAAGSGSQTTVCDGLRVWEKLSPETREAFTSLPVSYTRDVPQELWQKFAAYCANDGRDPEEMTISDLYNLSNDYGTVKFHEIDDGGIRYEFSIYAARKVRGGSRISWANSIFGPSYNYDEPDIRLADGHSIPETVLQECREVSDSVTEEINWQDGDVVLIDNSRVMHGRRAITDPDRTILNAQSYAA
jgi:alpha-ketoglutarate-dependent taurine dioxygenase